MSLGSLRVHYSYQSDKNSNTVTRIERINEDFYHAFGAIVIRSATNYTNFHELNIHFVHVKALSRKRSLCLNS